MLYIYYIIYYIYIVTYCNYLIVYTVHPCIHLCTLHRITDSSSLHVLEAMGRPLMDQFPQTGAWHPPMEKM